jgi:transcriptional regulator with XRE-family HTH domain
MAFSLKATRVNAELTRPAVVKRLKDEHGIEISINTLANYENKQSQPDVITAKALASIYGTSVDNIIFL